MLKQWRHQPADVPRINERSDRYHLRLARTEAEIDAVLKLRFDIFNLELGEGLDSAYAEMRDRDRFDQYCEHLLVEDSTTGTTIGTYRLIPFDTGREHGFYSDDEFVLADLPEATLRQSIELGRACIAAEHRNTRVLYLLWLGLARYMQATGARYFFGCCSLTSQSAQEGLAVAEYLDVSGHRRQDFRVRVRDTYRLSPTLGGTPARVPIPKLMRLYLQYGAEIVSDPAIDRHFKTIDFLALFDINSLDARARRLFGLDAR
ncbi:MAG: GNAT family N-acyltransferase [Pseudomonadota bacterium]